MSDLIDAGAIAGLQRQCHAMICSVGGYWPPTAGVCRILEEVGELVHAVQAETTTEVLEEAADAVIIITAVANQYCVQVTNANLRESRTNTISEVDVASLIQRLTINAGAMSRCVLKLEGIKPPKSNEKPISLASCYADCLITLEEIFKLNGKSIINECSAVTASKTKRDANRFTSRFDPVAAPVLDRVRPVVNGTSCPFAADSRLWGCDDWEVGETLQAYVRRSIPIFQRFVSVTRNQVIDGLVLQVPTYFEISQVADLASATSEILRTLNAADPMSDKALFENVLAPEWEFNFSGANLFVVVMSDIYPETSSRQAINAKGSFLLFQPEISFQNAKVPREETKEQTRNRIRDKFSEDGRDYRGQIIESPFQAPRYIKPLKGGDEQVKWWEVT